MYVSKVYNCAYDENSWYEFWCFEGKIHVILRYIEVKVLKTFLKLLSKVWEPRAKLHLNPIRVKPGPGRPGLNEKSCQIEMNWLNLFSIGDFSSWSLLYPLKKLFLQYHYNNFEKWGPKVGRVPLELAKKHELTSVGPHLTTLGGQIGSKSQIFENMSLLLYITCKISLSL